MLPSVSRWWTLARLARRKHWTTLYFVQAAAPPHLVHIGETLDLDNRVWRLRENCPVALACLCSMLSTTMGAVMVTTVFADLRERGQWYRPDERLMGFVRACLETRCFAPQIARETLPRFAGAAVTVLPELLTAYAAGFDELPKRARQVLQSTAL